MEASFRGPVMDRAHVSHELVPSWPWVWGDHTYEGMGDQFDWHEGSVWLGWHGILTSAQAGLHAGPHGANLQYDSCSLRICIGWVNVVHVCRFKQRCCFLGWVAWNDKQIPFLGCLLTWNCSSIMITSSPNGDAYFSAPNSLTRACADRKHAAKLRLHQGCTIKTQSWICLCLYSSGLPSMQFDILQDRGS